MASEEIGGFYSEPRPISAAQRKKLKKKQQTMMMEAQLSAEKQSAPNLAAEEDVELMRQLVAVGKTIFKIPGDGNCMFRAVEQQLTQMKQRGGMLPVYDHVQLREMTVQHIKSHRNDFEAFVYSVADDIEGDGDMFEAYCQKIARDGEWGGELELRALSEVLSCNIVVYKQDSQPVVYGNDNPTESIYIVFHQHAYSMGGHYNATT